MTAAILKRVVALDCGRLDHRNPHGGREEQLRAPKRRRSHTDDRELVLVDPHLPPHNTRIVVEMAMPVGIAQHHVGRAILPVLIGGVIKAPQVGLNAQRVEVVPTGHVRPCGGRISAGIHAHRTNDVEGCQALKSSVPVAQIDIIEVGLRRIPATLHQIKIPRIWNVHRS
jgi:hypothetical protein